MSAVITDAAFGQIQEIAASPGGKKSLSRLLSVVHAAVTPNDLFSALPGTVRLAKRKDADVFVVRLGRFRAGVATDPGGPDRMVVASVDRADEDESDPLRDIMFREEASLS